MKTILTVEQSRAWERSSNFRATVKAAGKTAWQNGMDLLKQIWAEEKAKRDTLWAAPDAEDFARHIQQVTPKADAKLIEETIEAFTPDAKLAEKASKVAAENRQAKKELRELASKI